MSDELNILKLVCHRLELANLPYMLTGSFAANFYAVPRMTRDIDIVIEIRESDVQNLFQIFHDDFYIDKDSIADAIKHQSMFNIIYNEFVFKVDFIVRKNAPYRKTEFHRKRQIQLDDAPIWIVAPEDLIISKLFWAKDSFSEIQLRDIKNLLHTIKNLDKNYIDSWVRELGLNDIYERV